MGNCFNAAITSVVTSLAMVKLEMVVIHHNQWQNPYFHKGKKLNKNIENYQLLFEAL